MFEPVLPEHKYQGEGAYHGYSSSTPTTDGERLYVFFGKSGVYCLDLDGNEIWQAGVGTGTHGWGSSNSPVLHKDLVIINASVESNALVALDKNSGKEVWRQKGLGITWASPVLVETKDGKHEVVINVPGKIECDACCRLFVVECAAR